MADEHAAGDVERPTDLDQIVGIAVEAGIFAGIISGKVRPARTDVIEQHREMVGLESRRDEAPHVLVAAEAMRENHGPMAGSGRYDMIAGNNSH